jgi:hypothetical protein
MAALEAQLGPEGVTMAWLIDPGFVRGRAAVGAVASWPLRLGIPRGHVNYVNWWRPKVVNSGSRIRPIPRGRYAAALGVSNAGV